jgi:hypothetical protein
MAAALDGDVICVGAGEYALPTSWTLTTITFDGVEDTTILTGDPVVNTTQSVILNRVTIAGEWSVLGKLGAVGVNATGRVTSSGPSSGVVFADFTGNKPVMGNDGATGAYLPPRFAPGGPCGRRPSEYRLVGSILAPARGKKTSASSDERFVTIGSRRFRREEQTGKEGVQGSLLYAETTGVLFCRGGFPFSSPMVVEIGDQRFEIKGIAQTPGPDNETKLYVNERKRGV